MNNKYLLLLFVGTILYQNMSLASSPIDEIDNNMNHSNHNVVTYVPLNTNIHINSELQQKLIDCGSEILTKLYSNQTVDNKNYYADTGIKNIVEDSNQRWKISFNSLGEKAPSTYIRSMTTWWYSNEETIKKENEIKEYLSRIVCIAWILSDQIEKTKQGYVSGSLKVVDHEFKLYNFLLDYVRLTTGLQEPGSIPTLTTTHNRGYRRDPNAAIIPGSSHYKHFMPESQFGIDIRFETWQTILKLLPAEKAHILFGKIIFDQDQTLPLTFIKFEYVGLGSTYEAAGHLSNLQHTSTLHESGRKEKYMPEAIKEFYTSFCTKIAEVEHKHALKSIRHMWQHIELKKDAGTLQEFKNLLQNYFPHDLTDEILSHRSGNEVILDFRNLII